MLTVSVPLLISIFSSYPLPISLRDRADRSFYNCHPYIDLGLHFTLLFSWVQTFLSGQTWADTSKICFRLLLGNFVLGTSSGRKRLN